MALYRKKPVVIEAQRLPLDTTEGTRSLAEIAKWCSGEIVPTGMIIRTLEGDMTADPGDWVIKGVKGEFYPCKPDIFAATYEPASDAPSGQDRVRDTMANSSP
jgi:hypothetical protein